MKVRFVKSATTRYRSLLERPDGVTVEFEGGSYNKVGGVQRVPHDLAHLVVEDELGLTTGVWGVLAAGGLFAHATVVAGRQAPHAAARGRELVTAAREDVMQAEVLTRAVCDVLCGELPADRDALRRVIGPRYWSDGLTRDVVDRCGTRLRALAEAWRDLSPGGALIQLWERGPSGRPVAGEARPIADRDEAPAAGADHPGRGPSRSQRLPATSRKTATRP